MRLLVLSIATALLAVPATAAEQPIAKEGNPVTGRWVVIETNKGTIKFALYEADAPVTTKNFVGLVERRFYDGLKFHRVVPDFVIQGGDPNGDGTGGSEKTIKLEVSPKLKHDAAGVVAMARKPDPDTASCQFYITLAAVPYLDMKYAVFGRVTEGMDVVRRIRQGDVMKTVRIVAAPVTDAEDGKDKDKASEAK